MSLKKLILLFMVLTMLAGMFGCASTPANEAVTDDQPVVPEDEVTVATFIMWQDFIDLDMRYAFASEISATLLC